MSQQKQGDDPNFPLPDQQAAMNIKSPYIQGEGPATEAVEVRENTSPASPPVPAEPGAGMGGIETAAPTDNLGVAR